MSEALARSEQNRLAELESVIEAGLETFVEVGEALATIRDEELWRHHGVSSFNAYLEERWQMHRSRGYQLMSAAEVVGNVSKKLDTAPDREAHAKPLATLDPEEQPEAWQEAVETAPEDERTGEKKVTAKHVEAVVERRKGSGKEKQETPTNGRRAADEDGPTLEEIIREGMASDENDATIIADALPVGVSTFKKGRYVLLLADDPVLSEENRQRVEEAVEYMNRHGHIEHPYSMVEDLVELRFGDANNRKTGAHRSADRHTREFMHSYGAIVQACRAADEVSVPLLSAERGAAIEKEVEGAIAALKSFRNRIREATQ